MRLNFEINDISIIHSIYRVQGVLKTGATVLDILNTGDAFDRSIATFDELVELLPKLLTAQLIVIKKDKIVLTKKYGELRASVKQQFTSLNSEFEIISKILDEVSKIDFASLIELPEEFLTEPKWQAVYAQYLNEFKT